MLVRRHLQADRARRGARQVDHHPFDQGDVLVTGERILPLLDPRRANVRADHGHGAGAALVLLEGGDPVAVWRPGHHRLVGVLPAGVVGGIAVVRRAIEGELGLLAGGTLAQPQVPVADEGLATAVGRGRARLAAAFDPLDHLAAAGLAVIVATAGGHPQAVPVQAYAGHRQAPGIGRPALAAGGAVHRRGQGLGRERRHRRALPRLQPQVLDAVGAGQLVQHAAVIEPVHHPHQSVHQRQRALAEHGHRALVVGRRHLRRFLAHCRSGHAHAGHQRHPQPTPHPGPIALPHSRFPSPRHAGATGDASAWARSGHLPQVPCRWRATASAAPRSPRRRPSSAGSGCRCRLRRRSCCPSCRHPRTCSPARPPSRRRSGPRHWPPVRRPRA